MRLRKREHLQFIIKFRADECSDKMAFPLQLASSKEMAKLDELIYLEGPSGSLWEVKLSKRGDQIYLEEGWKEFVYDHHVMEDDYLAFNYCGKSCFAVLFFEKNGCEKAASYFVMKGKVSESTKELQARRKRGPNSSEVNECSYTKAGHCDDKQRSLDDGSFSDQSAKSSKTENGRISQAASKLSSFLKTEKMIMEKKKNSSQAEKKNSSQAEVRALNIAKSISKRNPCFLKVLSRNSIITRLILRIPNDFVMEFKLFNPQIIILQIPSKKEWLVNYTRQGLSWFLLWKTFVKDNSFEEGDVCVFELTVTRPKMVMVVHIFRA